MSTERNKAIARRHFEELWERGRLTVADEIYSTDAVGHCGNYPDQSGYPDSEKRLIERDRMGFPDARIVVEDQIGEGDRVLTRWSLEATNLGAFAGNAPTGHRVRSTGFHVHRFSGDKIIEVWALGDTLGLMRQLGLAATP